jgi:hypothetical protein
MNHIQVLGFLLFPYFSHACSPLSMRLMSNNICWVKRRIFEKKMVKNFPNVMEGMRKILEI